jgi:ribosomal protein L21
MPLVRFLNTQSWVGEKFCAQPGDIIELEEAIAIAREKAGLGSVVVDKSKVKAKDKRDEPSN